MGFAESVPERVGQNDPLNAGLEAERVDLGSLSVRRPIREQRDRDTERVQVTQHRDRVVEESDIGRVRTVGVDEGLDVEASRRYAHVDEGAIEDVSAVAGQEKPPCRSAQAGNA